MKNYPIIKNASILALLAALSILVAGYHPGAEDDAVYLAAIKRDLNPSLFPHDSEFFTVQLQATIFDKLVAASVRATHLPLGVVILAWHYLAIVLLLWGCWRISWRCFADAYAQWASVGLVAALLTLPIAGSGLYLVDQNLHPRVLATVAILAAIVATVDRKYALTGGLLMLAFVIHPIMASFGISLCVFLAWRPVPGHRVVGVCCCPSGVDLRPHIRRLAGRRRYEELLLSLPLAVVRVAGCFCAVCLPVVVSLDRQTSAGTDAGSYVLSARPLRSLPIVDCVGGDGPSGP